MCFWFRSCRFDGLVVVGCQEGGCFSTYCIWTMEQRADVTALESICIRAGLDLSFLNSEATATAATKASSSSIKSLCVSLEFDFLHAIAVLSVISNRTYGYEVDSYQPFPFLTRNMLAYTSQLASVNVIYSWNEFTAARRLLIIGSLHST